MGKFKKPGTGARPGRPIDEVAALRDWAQTRVQKKGFLVTQRIVRAREGRIEDFTERVPSEFGVVGLFAAAHLLSRDAAQSDLIAVLGTTCPGRHAKRGDGIFLCARSRSGKSMDELWLYNGPGALTPGRGAIRSESLNSEFLEPDYPVDPVIETGLAKLGFPGATSRELIVPPAPISIGIKPTLRTRIADFDPLAASSIDTDPQDWPWETLGQHAAAFLAPNRVLQRPWIRTFTFGAVDPPGLNHLPLSELLVRYGGNPAFAIALSVRMLNQREYRSVSDELIGAPNMAPEVRLWFAVAAIDCAACRGHHPGQSADLIDRAEALAHALTNGLKETEYLAGAADRLRRRAAARWDGATPVGDIVRTASAIGGISALALWRTDLACDVASTRSDDVGLHALRSRLAELDSLRDTLLVIASERPLGESDRPALRLRRTFEAIVGRARTSSFTNKQADLLDALNDPRSGDIVLESLRRTALFHAYQLHSRAAFYRLHEGVVQRNLAAANGAWAPLPFTHIDVSEIFDTESVPIARAAVLEAATTSDPSDVRRLIEFARRLSPGDELVQICTNEAEFRLGERSRALLNRLRNEGDDIGALAEAWTISEAIGDSKRDVLLRKLVMRTADMSVGWVVRVASCRRRPGEWSKAPLLQQLLAETPDVEWLDQRDRFVHAVYGPDPHSLVMQWREELSAQLAVLASAETLAIERLEERLTRPPPPRRERPPVPSTWADGATLDAIHAVEWRLSRPALATLRQRRDVHLHLRRALALTDLEDAVAPASPLYQALETWLVSLRGDTSRAGLVPALELAIAAGDDTEVDAALYAAEAALGDAFLAAWAGQTQRRLNLLESRALDTLARERLAALRGRASAAPGGTERQAIDVALSELEGERDCRRDPQPPITPADDEVPKPPDDGFRQMIVLPLALERSRRDLDSPEWAITAGLRQVALFNAARGRRDLKMLASTRDQDGALWELRHQDGRHPVRVLWRLTPQGPAVVAIMVKDDEADQRRVIARVQQWR